MPGLGTVLANEEVTVDGRSDIGNFPVSTAAMAGSATGVSRCGAGPARWLGELIRHATRLSQSAQAGSGQARATPRALAESLDLVVAPLVPHIAEELWRRLGHPGSLAYEPFPAADPTLAAAETPRTGTPLDSGTQPLTPRHCQYPRVTAAFARSVPREGRCWLFRVRIWFGARRSERAGGSLGGDARSSRNITVWRKITLL